MLTSVMSLSSDCESAEAFWAWNIARSRTVSAKYAASGNHPARNQELWASEAAFEAWTTSDAFRKAHAGAKPREGIYLGPPNLEFFEVLQSVK